jgi:hypothetical protein
MVREVVRGEMALESAPLSAAVDHHYQYGCAAALNLSFAKLTVTFRATDKILPNLLGRFPFRDLNPVPVSTFVIDEHMRTGTLNSRLYLESHPVAVGRGANLIDISLSCRSHSLIPTRSLKETWFVI